MTIDLTDNKIPLGLLSEEEQEYLLNWPHGLEILVFDGLGCPSWREINAVHRVRSENIYRTIPAPVEPERHTCWLYSGKIGTLECDDRDYAEYVIRTQGGFAFRIEVAGIEFDAETGDNPTIVKETFDEI